MPTKPLSELRDLVGESRHTVEGLRIEAGKVEEFARAVNDEDPVHREESAAAERGFDAVPAPLTFTRTAYFPRYRPEGIDENLGFDLGLRKEYLVHGEQEYEFERPAEVGDVLDGTTTLTDVYQREGSRGGTMTFAIYETEFRDQGGELVCTARLTRIETGGAIEEDGAGGADGTDDEGGEDGDGEDEEGEDEEGEDEEGEDEEGEDEEGEARADGGEVGGGGRTTGDVTDYPSAGDLAVGDEAPGMVVEDVERRDFVRYAGASGDFNPIHYDDTYARAAGNERVFGQGMLTAGYAATMAANWLGVENVTRFGVRFRAQLWPGDTVTVTGEVTEVTDDGAVTAELVVANGDGDPLVTGEVEADPPA